MATSEFLTFGDSGTDGVNKLSLINYTADQDRVYGNGYTTTLIRSQLHNKVLQQTSKMSAAVAQFLVNNNISALDTDAVATIATNIGGAVGAQSASSTHAATSKTTPVDADEIPIMDSAASFGLKKLTIQNLKKIPRTGTVTNDSAAAGEVGEYISSEVLVASAVPLTTNTGANVTSISLSAGDWDVNGIVLFSGIATIGMVFSDVSITTGGKTTLSAGTPMFGAAFDASTYGAIGIPTGNTRISIASTTTVYLIAFSNFSAGTGFSAFGKIHARRIR